MCRAYIIAEAGVNHNGQFDLAEKMVLAAKKAGADAIKFQTFKAENLVTKTTPKAHYQKVNTGTGESQFEMLKKLELTCSEYKKLKNLCDNYEIDFLSTPFDLGSIEMLEEIGADKYKLPSGEITNYPYLVRLAQTGKPIILSTGMCTLEEVKEAIAVLKKNGSGQLILLHCTTEYPAPFTEVNLRAMVTMKEQLGIDTGYSDHTTGIEIAIAAAVMGACVIEKHFTLDKTMEGPDHKASLEPDELAAMVNSIRNVELGMGEGIMEQSQSESKNMVIARKSIVAKQDIYAGQIFSDENITAKRPGTGISPMKWNEVIGTAAKRDFKKDELIEI